MSQILLTNVFQLVVSLLHVLYSSVVTRQAVADELFRFLAEESLARIFAHKCDAAIIIHAYTALGLCSPASGHLPLSPLAGIAIYFPNVDNIMVTWNVWRTRCWKGDFAGWSLQLSCSSIQHPLASINCCACFAQLRPTRIFQAISTPRNRLPISSAHAVLGLERTLTVILTNCGSGWSQKGLRAPANGSRFLQM